jgi:hypothetical protein
MDKCLAFFPFKITHILTDNGLEITNRLLKSKIGNSCKYKTNCLINEGILRFFATFTVYGPE